GPQCGPGAAGSRGPRGGPPAAAAARAGRRRRDRGGVALGRSGGAVFCPVARSLTAPKTNGGADLTLRRTILGGNPCLPLPQTAPCCAPKTPLHCIRLPAPSFCR